jgi:hypothetical protein
MAQLETLYINGVPQFTLSGYTINIKLDTDYDYYTTYTESVEQYLRDNGFSETSHSDKCGRGYTQDYALDDEAIKILENGNVQVVLRKDAEFYRTVFESISVNFYYDFLWKSSPASPIRSNIQPIFNALFKAAHSMRNTTN